MVKRNICINGLVKTKFKQLASFVSTTIENKTVFLSAFINNVKLSFYSDLFKVSANTATLKAIYTPKLIIEIKKFN